MAAKSISRAVYGTVFLIYTYLYMNGYSQEFIEEMRAKLLAQQSKLQDDMSGLHAHTEMGDDRDGNADEVAVDEVNQDLMARIKADLDKIVKALQKIDVGTYGYDESGKMIGEDRLRAIPWADTAI
jgi:RNA polymerase-binding transcription factor DksA